MCCCLSLFLGLFSILPETQAAQDDLCVCSLPTRCEAGKGCIVTKGECNTEACPFPRLFMCDMTTIQSDNTVTCGVMEGGWEVCAESPESTRDGFQVMKPRPE